jgi:hypothetical protein
VKTTIAMLAAGTLLLAGCHSTTAGSSVQVTTTETLTHPPAVGSPVVSGPTSSADADACPYLDEETAANDVGVRMGRITVQTSGGKVVGCRFYATTDPSFVASEHLPGPSQPVLEIDTSAYPDDTSAHNAMVATAQAGGGAYTNSIGSLEGISFQTTFDPTDGNKDWAFIFAKGVKLVTVLTAQSDTAFNARAVAADIAAKF